MNREAKHPIQPVIKDERGTYRFKSNSVVRFLLDNSKFDLNFIVNSMYCNPALGFTQEDVEQFYQLIGYSVSGICDLSFISDELCNKGLNEANALDSRASTNDNTISDSE